MKWSRFLADLWSRDLSVDLASGLAAGICGAGVTSAILALDRPLSLMTHARFAVLSIASFLTIAGITNLIWRMTLRRKLLSCILIALLGSVLFTALRLVPGIIQGWTQGTETSLAGYLLNELDAARSVVILLTFVTLPVTAVVQYGRQIVKALGAWHEGAEPLHVLDKNGMSP